jgi:hypothetical protein
MLSLAIEKTAVKNFMGQLLRESHFDLFFVRNIDLTLTTHISISGKLENKSDEKVYTTWGDQRPLIFDLIKRGTKPGLLKIVFSHPTPTEIHTNAAALFLNLTYENNGVSFTTATSQREFALDKTLDTTWDEWVLRFFTKINIKTINNLEDKT